MCPHAGQTGQHIIQAGNFHLCFGVCGLGPLGEYFQNQAGTVYNLGGFYNLLDITLLHSGEFVVEDAVANIVIFAILLNFSKFTTSYIGGLFRFVDPLDEFLITYRTCGFGKEFQLVQILHYLGFIVVLLDDPYKYRFFGRILFSFVHFI